MEQLPTGGKYMSARRTGAMHEASASPLPPSYRPLEHKNQIYVMGVNAVHASSLNTQPEVVNTGKAAGFHPISCHNNHVLTNS